MGGVIVGETREESRLQAEIQRLRRRVERGLLDGTINPRPGRVDVWWDTVWRFRNWRFRKVNTYRSSPAMWTSFGVLAPGDDPDEYSICFVSSDHKLGTFVGYTSKGCYIQEFDGIFGETYWLVRWIKGLQAILGELPENEKDHIFVNPA